MINSLIYNEDCLQAMKSYPDKYFDLALADVPYGIGESRKVLSRFRPVIQKNGKKIKMEPLHKIKTWDDKQPTQEYFDELFRVSKHQVIFGCNYLQFTQKNSSSGRIFWDKVNGNSSFSDGELLWTNLFSSIRQVTYMWNGFCQGCNLDEPTRQRGNKKLNERRIHPTQKPTALYYWILQNFAQKHWRILDTHLGSGSSRIVCHELGLDFSGYEIDTEYFDLHNNWFSSHLARPSLFAG